VRSDDSRAQPPAITGGVSWTDGCAADAAESLLTGTALVPDPFVLPCREIPRVDWRAWHLLHGDRSPGQRHGTARIIEAAIHEARAQADRLASDEKGER
jgi:hypothetical protein